MRPRRLVFFAALLALMIVSLAITTPLAARSKLSFTWLASYNTGLGAGSAEIVAYEKQRLYLISTGGNALDIVDLSKPATPTLLRRVDLSPYGAGVNSVAIRDGLVAVALEASPKTSPGSVGFFNRDGVFLRKVTVGALPDMLTFAPNGRLLVVANEGEPSSYGQPDSVDPEGSVSIIDVQKGINSVTQQNVTTLSFADFNAGGPKHNQLDPRVRIFGPNASVAQDLEPEYIAVASNSETAWVTLQENNAIAILDLKRKSFDKIVSLGFKDHSVAGNALDASDRDGPGSTTAINIASWPVLGMYQPDTIATYRTRGGVYLVTANEGDARDYTGFSEERRVSALTLDPTAFPNAAALRNNAALGRLNVTSTLGNTDGDADYDKLYAFGARSFAIWSDKGELVFDSGDQLERKVAELAPTFFNSEGAIASFDTRSDNKGPEPEGVTLGYLNEGSYAFISLERVGGVMIYDVTEPSKPVFVQYVSHLLPDGTAAADLAPEGLALVAKQDSPVKHTLLLVGNEVSGTVSIYVAND